MRMAATKCRCDSFIRSEYAEGGVSVVASLFDECNMTLLR
jgi:hypothetical protein